MMEQNKRWRATAVTGLAGFLFATFGWAETQPWMDATLPPQQRAQLLLSAMTQEEKFQQMVGAPGIVAELPHCHGGRHVPGLPRLAIPTFRITNGPVGVGQNDCVPADTLAENPGTLMLSPHSAKATALPAAIALAATFDRDAAARFGDILGKQSRSLALHVMEGPGINLARMPHGGRNFEYFGEDPFLAGEIGVAQIKAIQSHGVIAMPKHYIANEQETDRKTMDAIIDDRTLHQLYLLPFEMAVKDADVASVMCSYNLVNGVQVCENRHLLTEVLRDRWGFEGYVQSDFFAVQSLSALQAGMDHEMPGFRLDVPGYRTWYTPENFTAALAAGDLAMEDIDLALTRRYVQMFRLGIFDRPVEQYPLDIVGDGAIAAELGVQGSVLLKNNGPLLPLDARKVRTIALIGKSDYAEHAVVGGGGSSKVIPFYTLPALEGMKRTLAELGADVEIRLVVVDDDNGNLAAAAQAAKQADIAVVLAGGLSSEGEDLDTIALPLNQDDMITAVATANANTVLVLKNNAASLMPWLDQVPAILQAWFPGQEDGVIVSRLLFGQANPSGKLPVTYPRSEADLPATTLAQWPGIVENGIRRVEYTEKRQIGYRWFDAQGIEPLFPFGHGLSYTTFELRDIRVTPATLDEKTPVRVSVTVSNTGDRAGAEVPQVYLGFPPEAGEPPKRLVGFEKVWLEPGESRTIEIQLDPQASSHPFGIFNDQTKAWENPPGEYTVLVGTSSADIISTHKIQLKH